MGPNRASLVTSDCLMNTLNLPHHFAPLSCFAQPSIHLVKGHLVPKLFCAACFVLHWICTLLWVRRRNCRLSYS